MDKDLKHMCWEIGLGKKNIKILKKKRIHTIEQLLNIEDLLKRGNFGGLREGIISKLLASTEWLKRNRGQDIVDNFDSDVFGKWEEDLKAMKERRGTFIRSYLQTLGNIDDSNIEFARKMHIEFEKKESALEEVMSACKREMEKCENLQQGIGNFDIDGLINKVVRHMHQSLGHAVGNGTTVCHRKRIVFAGRTQSGKTSIKAAIQYMCYLMKIPLIILTKGVTESIDLHSKLEDFAKNTHINQKNIVVASGKFDGSGSIAKKDLIDECLQSDSGGTLVIADTECQVCKKACNAIERYRKKVPNGKFFFVIDEADAMFRTEDKRQKFEQALQRLQRLNPVITTYISATPLPLLLDLIFKMKDEVNDEDDESDDNDIHMDIDFFNLEPGNDYIGFDDTRPLQNNYKKDIYLEQNEINCKSEFESIPYCTEKNMALYEDAISHVGKKKGILLLDASCPRVNVERNVSTKAEKVQDHYNEEGQDLIVITIVGRGIEVKFPHEDWDRETWKKSLIGKVLQEIDDDYGLEVPIFVFGYSKMRRGISFRSNKRVPTHMLMMLTRGHNMSTVIQTLGRATYNGKRILEENGFESVTVLTTLDDYKSLAHTQSFIDEIGRRVKNGDTLKAALTGANEKLPDDTNWLRRTFRKVGPMKGCREQYQAVCRFEDAPHNISEEEEEFRIQYWTSIDGQKVLRSLTRLHKKHPKINYHDIIDDMIDRENVRICRKKLKGLLQSFCDHCLIHKDENRWYTLQRDLTLFMNEQLGDIPCRDDSEDDSSTNYDETSNVLAPIQQEDEKSESTHVSPRQMERDIEKTQTNMETILKSPSPFTETNIPSNERDGDDLISVSQNAYEGVIMEEDNNSLLSVPIDVAIAGKVNCSTPKNVKYADVNVITQDAVYECSRKEPQELNFPDKKRTCKMSLKRKFDNNVFNEH